MTQPFASYECSGLMNLLDHYMASTSASYGKM